MIQGYHGKCFNRQEERVRFVQEGDAKLRQQVLIPTTQDGIKPVVNEQNDSFASVSNRPMQGSTNQDKEPKVKRSRLCPLNQQRFPTLGPWRYEWLQDKNIGNAGTIVSPKKKPKNI